MRALETCGVLLIGLGLGVVLGMLVPRRSCVFCPDQPAPRPVRKSALPLPSPSRN